MEKETVDFLCEVVRFEKSIRKQLKGQQLEITKKKKIQMAYGHMDKMIQRYCDFLHVEVPEYEGLEFEIGLPVDPLNLEDFEEADTVTVTGGAWEGTVGMIQTINMAKQSLTINVDLFGRETPVEISFAEVKKM